MTTSTSNSQSIAVTTSAQAVHWPQFFDDILVVNTTNVPVWITTDGTSAVAGGAGADVVPAGASLVLSNRQPRQPAVTTAPGSTAQALTVPASGYLTFVSVVAASAPTGTTTVVVSPQ